MGGERKRAMRELMVDIETMGTGKDAPIIQIGAVYFSMETGKTGDEFLINIDLEDSMKNGVVPDARTIYWWAGQSSEAGRMLQDPAPVNEFKGLQEFNQFAARATRVWSHATFDFVMLMTAMQRMDIKPMIHYRKARDIRTLTGLAGMTRDQINMFKVDRPGVHHNGLDDAIYQVAYCHECFKILKGDKE
jgi:exodeoxyribonuclease VIII